jgi:hypothetical protein
MKIFPGDLRAAQSGLERSRVDFLELDDGRSLPAHTA